MITMLDMLEQVFWGNTVLDYLKALLLFIVLVVIIIIAKHFLLKRLRARAKRKDTEIDTMLVEGIRKYLVPLCYYGALYFGTKLLYWTPTLNRVLNIISLAVLAALGAVFLSSVISFILSKYWERKYKDSDNTHAVHWISIAVKILIWAVALILFLDNAGIKISALVAGLGIGGVAIAFAAQAMLEDIFSFFSIFFDRPFEIGDFITVGEMSGTVENIGIKTIRIRSISGEQLVFSNKDMTNSRLRNYKRMEKRRVLFTIGVTYDTPLQTLKELPVLFREIVEQVPETAFDRAHFSAFADYSQNFEVVYYVLSGDYVKFMDVQQEIYFRVREAFDARGIEFAFPTQTLHLQQAQSGAPGQDGPRKPGSGPVLL